MMSKRDPYDPDGEYEGRNCTREDCFCSQEGYFMIETQDEPISADITTLGDDTCAGEFKRETMEDTLRTTIADLTEAINVAGRHTQYLIDMRKDLAEHLNALSDYRGASRNII